MLVVLVQLTTATHHLQLMMIYFALRQTAKFGEAETTEKGVRPLN